MKLLNDDIDHARWARSLNSFLTKTHPVQENIRAPRFFHFSAAQDRFGSLKAAGSGLLECSAA
jgi:hypothetical protein